MFLIFQNNWRNSKLLFLPLSQNRKHLLRFPLVAFFRVGVDALALFSSVVD